MRFFKAREGKHEMTEGSIYVYYGKSVINWRDDYGRNRQSFKGSEAYLNMEFIEEEEFGADNGVHKQD